MQTINVYITTFVLNALWQAIAITGVTHVCDRAIRSLPARYRHLMWAAALILCLLIPAMSVAGGKIRFPFSWGQIAQTRKTVPNSGISSDGSNDSQEFQSKTPVSVLISPAIVTNGVAVLFIGALAYQFWKRLLAWRRANNLGRDAYLPNLTEAATAIVQRCEAVFKVNSIPILLSPRVAGPLTGMLGSVIVLPERLLVEDSDDLFASAVAHEMAHIRRHDFIVNLMLEVLAIPIAFHPAVAHIKRRLGQTREFACDEMVVDRFLDPTRYAQALVTLAHSVVGETYALAASNMDILEERVMKLLDAKSSITRPKAIAMVISIVALFAALIVLSPGLALQVRGQQSQTASASSIVTGEWILLTDTDKVSDDNGIRLVFTVNGEQLNGTAIIPKEMNGTPAGESRLELIEPKFDGQELSFRIKDVGVMIAKLKLAGAEFVGTYQIEKSDEKGTLKLIRKK